MNITPINYANYNRYDSFNKKNSNPSFGAIRFSEAAQQKITQILSDSDTFTRSMIISKLQKMIAEGQKTRDILVDAPNFTTGLIAKVGAKNPENQKYGLRTFIQSSEYDLKFLKDALKESKNE